MGSSENPSLVVDEPGLVFRVKIARVAAKVRTGYLTNRTRKRRNLSQPAFTVTHLSHMAQFWRFEVCDAVMNGFGSALLPGVYNVYSVRLRYVIWRAKYR